MGGLLGGGGGGGGGQRVCWPPLSNYWGGAWPPLAPPLPTPMLDKVLKKSLFLVSAVFTDVEIALIMNRIFSKTLSRNI